jgi:SNF2 family DNA or RNA helicase
MHIDFKPWARRASGDGTVEHQTAAAMLVRMHGESKASWVPKAAISNLNEIASALNGLATLSQNIKGTDDLDVPKVCHTKPWRHQLEAYAYVRRMWAAGDGAMLEYGMGTGKTLVAILAMMNTPGCAPALIVCPKSVVQNWVREIGKHGVSGALAPLPLDKYSVAKRAEIAQQHIRKYAGSQTVPVIIVNYDVVWREDFQPALKGINTIILDESQKAKSHNGQTARFLGRFAPKCRYRLAMTGTPMPHSPLDIFAQYRAICPGVFGTRFSVFRSRYAMMGGFQGKQVVGYQNEAELRAKYLTHALQCDRSVLDLPEALHITRSVTLGKETSRIYREMEKTFVADVGAGVVTAANAMVSLLRLAQITGGCVPVENGDSLRVGREKQENLEDLLDGLALTEPVVVFCRFRADIDAVHDAARNTERGSAELSGRVNELAAWQSGSVPVLAVQIQAGGVGIDLTRACYVVYWSVGYSLGDYEQSLARAHRPGQTRAVTFYHIVAEGTIDEKIYAALETKKDIVDSILGDLTTATTK